MENVSDGEAREAEKILTNPLTRMINVICFADVCSFQADASKGPSYIVF